MRVKIKSISSKIILLYLFLAITNMSIFSILMVENQIGLIAENTKHNAEKHTANIIRKIQALSNDYKTASLSQSKVIDKIAQILKVKNNKEKIKKKSFIEKIKERFVVNTKSIKFDSFVIFKETSKSILYKSHNHIKVTDRDIQYAVKSMANVEFGGQLYYSTIDEDSYKIYFYIPMKVYKLDGSILLLAAQMQNFDTEMSKMMWNIIFTVSLIAILHILFALALFKIIIKPIKSLHETSIDISKGDLSVRSKISQKDEIGELAFSFNRMANSIQEKVDSLQDFNDMMQNELKMAGDVQQMIFPHIIENKDYNYSIFFKAFTEVSGDYYDIFNLGNDKYGFLLVDASGHGVPAALITMVAKEQFRLHAPKILNPAELFKKVNYEISTILHTHDTSGYYFSAFYFILDENKCVSYCSAGHPEPILMRSNKKETSYLTTNGFLVGISEDMNHLYETKMIQLESGDKIIMYTDGVSESMNEEDRQFSKSGIVEATEKVSTGSSSDILDSIVKEFSNFTDINDLNDDTTCIVVEVK